MRRLLTVGLLLAALPGLASAQQVVRLWEVSPGIADLSDAGYVTLRVQETCSLDGLALVVEDDSGISQGCFLRFAGAPPVETGYLLVGSLGFEAAYGFAPDFVADCARLARESGRLCLVDASGLIDCLAYGQFTGNNGTWGAPADGLMANQALERNQNTGLNVIDWQRTASATPEALLAGRILPPGGVSCGSDGGTPGPGDGGTLDPTYLEYPDGGLCDTTALGQTAADGGTISDGGTTTADAGGGGGTTGGGSNSQTYEPPSSCCGVATGQTAVILLPLGLALIFPGVGRRRWRG